MLFEYIMLNYSMFTVLKTLRTPIDPLISFAYEYGNKAYSYSGNFYPIFFNLYIEFEVALYSLQHIPIAGAEILIAHASLIRCV